MSNEIYFMFQTGGVGGGFGTLLPLVLMFVIFYFFLIRPQNKRQKEHQQMLSRLKKGDTIVTVGGLVGAIHSVSDTELTVEIAERTRVKVVRGQVAGIYQGAEAIDSKEAS